MIGQYTGIADFQDELYDMEWAKPFYSRKEVNKAGEMLVRGKPNSFELGNVLDVVDNFRSAHAFPLNTLQVNLRNHADAIDHESIIAQRLKRLSSILIKLDRFNTMRLWEMQDIGGCRAIMHDIESVNRLVDFYIKGSSRIRHKLVGKKDYILSPKTDGYRSRHLVYQYVSDKNTDYNGLKIEMQIRTSLQHAWATAVETVDAFTHQALKVSKGQSDWRQFFQLISTEIAFRENSPLVPRTPKDRQVWLKELRKCAIELRVRERLVGFANALRATEPVKDAKYFLLSLDNTVQNLSITGYNFRELSQASNDYAKTEKLIRESGAGDAVLVSVDSISNLRRAYPNYFADTDVFMHILDECMKE